MEKKLVGRHIEGLECRYWIFIKAYYYPKGGMGDFYKGTNDLKEVGKLVKNFEYYYNSEAFNEDYKVEVLDTETNKVLTLEY